MIKQNATNIINISIYVLKYAFIISKLKHSKRIEKFCIKLNSIFLFFKALVIIKEKNSLTKKNVKILLKLYLNINYSNNKIKIFKTIRMNEIISEIFILNSKSY